MKNLTKKITMLSSALGAIVILSGCTWLCGDRQTKKTDQQITEAVVFYNSYDEVAAKGVKARMYTHSVRGGQAEMGYIKLYQTGEGLNMDVNLEYLRPDVTYDMVIYKCKPCGTTMCCSGTSMPLELPTLRIDKVGRFEESFILHDVTANDFDHAKIYLERDGGYKAAWGTFKRTTMK